MIYGAAYYPEHRDPARWAFDLDRMADASVNSVRVGEFAWKRFEPRGGEYDFAWMDRFLDLAQARGIGLLMCPPMRTAPAWLVERDPAVLMVRDDGVRLEFGSRYTFCINHPLLRERGLALAGRLAAHYGPGPAIAGWHLDNEYGDEPDCHCPVCRAKWQAWLRARYHTAAALNAAWGTVFWGLEFDRFEQIPTPRVTKAMHNPALLLAWRRFRSHCTVELIREHAAAVRAHAPAGQFVTTNHQTWNHRTDYHAVAPDLDVAGTNYNGGPSTGPGARDGAFGLAACRGYKSQSFHVHELLSGPQNVPGFGAGHVEPGSVIRTALHVVANGADAIHFFRWRICPFGAEQHWGAITDYDGQPTRITAEVRAAGEGLRRLAPALAGTQVVSKVAVLHDFTACWLMETGQPLNVHPSLYMSRAQLLHRSVRALGMNCDVVGRGADFGRYRILLAPPLPSVDDELAGRLCDFVAGGGTLLWHPWSGMKDDEATVYPGRLHPRLGELLGVRLRDYLPLAPDQRFVTPDPEHPGAPPAPPRPCAIRWGGRDYEAGLYVDLVDSHGAVAEAEFASGWFAGRAAVLRNRFGSGDAVFVATFPEERWYADFLAAQCAAAGVRPIVPAPLPPEIEVTERRAADGRRLVFILNYSAATQTIALGAPMQDLWTQQAVGVAAGVPPHGVCVLTGT